MTIDLRDRQARVLRAIALFKFAKSATMVLVSLVLVRLLDHSVMHRLEEWLTPFLAGHRSLSESIGHWLQIDAGHLRLFAALTSLYAVLFAIEGAGLWLERRWGEWMTVVISSLLIPFEIWEIIEHATLMKLAIFAINVAIVVYLLRLLLRHRVRGVE